MYEINSITCIAVNELLKNNKINKEYIKKVKPDYIVILPWNLKAEIMEQLSFIRKWKGKFVIPIPNMRVV